MLLYLLGLSGYHFTAPLYVSCSQTSELSTYLEAESPVLGIRILSNSCGNYKDNVTSLLPTIQVAGITCATS